MEKQALVDQKCEVMLMGVTSKCETDVGDVRLKNSGDAANELE